MDIKPSKIFKIKMDISKTINGMSIEEADDIMFSEIGEFFTEDMREKGKVALNGNHTAYIRDNGLIAHKFYEVVSKYFNSSIEDISDIVIKDNSILTEMDDYCREYSYIMFEEYRKEYSSIDDVLDKIVDKGIDYIDDIDKEILENKNIE